MWVALSDIFVEKMCSPCMGGTGYTVKNDRVQDASPVHGWQLYARFGEKSTHSKMSTDKTSSVTAAVLQPLAGVATPVQSMN